MTGIRTIVLTIAVSCLLTACDRGLVWSEYQPVKNMAWHQDSAIVFSFPVRDIQTGYDLLVHIRHTERYPFQNMWLFTETQGLIVHSDTIEFYLADERGRWLGNGRNGLYDMPVLYEENIHFPDTGTYTLSIRHGMRSEWLNGVSDVGIDLMRHGEE